MSDGFAVEVEVAVGLAAHGGRAAAVGVVEDVVEGGYVVVSFGCHG